MYIIYNSIVYTSWWWWFDDDDSMIMVMVVELMVVMVVKVMVVMMGAYVPLVVVGVEALPGTQAHVADAAVEACLLPPTASFLARLAATVLRMLYQDVPDWRTLRLWWRVVLPLSHICGVLASLGPLLSGCWSWPLE